MCWKCNAKFTRLDHLKRHIHSVYLSPKSHSCEFCGKRFSRRDVLLRHHQSCRGAKFGFIEQEKDNLPSSDTCQNCRIQNTDCSGGEQCTSCKSQGIDCVYTCGRRTSIYTGDSQIKQASSPDMDHLSGRTLGGTPKARSSRHERPHGSSTTFEHVDTLSDRVLRDEMDFETSNIHRDEWFGDQPGSANFFQGNDGADISKLSPSHSVYTTIPEMSQSVNGEPSQKHQKIGSKRGRYTSIACANCQKRKVKCSGEQPCLLCRSSEIPCVYNRSRKRRSTADFEEANRKTMEHPTTERGTVPSNEELTSETISRMMARIISLENDRKIFKSHLSTVKDGRNTTSRSNPSSPHVFDETSPNSCVSDTSLPANEGFHAATGLAPSIEALNKSIVPNGDIQENSDTHNQTTSAPINWQDLSKGETKSLNVLEKETREIKALRHMIDLFFNRLNPQYPCLNENEFRIKLETFLADDIDQAGKDGDWFQFIALINIILAEVKVLSDDRTDSGNAPGWEEFLRTESILTHLIWLGNGNLWTIQVLINKARYLLLVEKSDAAFETLGQTTRLCFTLGLHNQASWTVNDPFQLEMRKRIFYSIVCFDRNLALNNGNPCLLRESDFKVDLPRSLDDREMFKNTPLPMECPQRSAGLYLSCTVKWGRLFTEIWENMFGIHAQKPVSPEFLASMDARILYAVSQLPPHLQYQRNINRLESDDETPEYVLRQTVILHLKMNQLRQLIRQESMLTLKYDAATASDCVAISTSSIDAISTHLNVKGYNPSDRWASVLYLIGSLLPLVCIIVRKENVQQTRADAIETFKRGVTILSNLAPNFGLARHTLRRLHKIIGTAMQAIHEADTSALDPKDFETEILAPQITDLFSGTHQLDLPKDLLDQQIGEAVGYDTFSMQDFPGEGIDESWLDNLLNNEHMLFATG